MTMPMINDHNHELWEFYVMAVMHLCNVLMPLWGFLISSLNLDKSRNKNFSATFQIWAYDVQAGAVLPLLPTGLQHHDWEKKEEEGAPSEVPACNPSPLSPSTHPHTFTFFNTFSLSLSLAFDHWQAGCFSTERKCARFLSFQIYWPHLDNSQFSFLFRTTTNPTSIFF